MDDHPNEDDQTEAPVPIENVEPIEAPQVQSDMGETMVSESSDADTQIVVPEVPMPEEHQPMVAEKPKHHPFRPENIFFPPLRRKLGSKARPLAILIIILVVLIGGGYGYTRLASTNNQTTYTLGSFKAQIVAFKLVSISPSNNATNVNTATHITLNFSSPVSANKLLNNMFITPTVNGTFVQGNSADQVIFVPARAFTQGVKYTVMINGTLQGNQGSQLGVPKEYVFTTSIPSNGVAFQDQTGLFDNLTSLASGQSETYSLFFGDSVGPSANVTLYKGSVNDLLSSLVYTNTSTGGYSYPDFSDLAVSTSGLSKVGAAQVIKNQGNYTVTQPDGLYVAVATDSSGHELGFVWVDISNFGVLLRQDDQKTMLDAQAFATSQDVAANATFYNLNGSVNSLGQQNVNGLTTANQGYDQNLDLVVATYNNETAIVPVNLLDSGGDIRVDQNLSKAQTVYAVTDKPSYNVGDSVNFAGFMRLNNDAQYISATNASVQLYVGNYPGEASPLTTLSVPVDSNGNFSGSFTTSSSWMTVGDNFDQFQIYAKAVSGSPSNDTSVGSFTLATTTNQTNNISVAFSKSSYLPSDNISATIKAVNGSGHPLANQSIALHIFSQDYYENNLAANQNNFGYTGTELARSPKTLQLDANGVATYMVSASSLPSDGNSQIVTAQANLPNQTGVGAAGGDSAVVHQGNGYITFGPNRGLLPKGADLVSDVYVNQLTNIPMANTSVQYLLVDNSNSNQLASGTATTNSSGLAVIDVPASQLTTNGDSMSLKATLKDQYGNTVLAQTYFAVADYANPELGDTSGASIYDLNISGTSGNVKVGDTVNLTINSPAAIRAMVTMDRGRIYQPTMVNLNQGNNTYSFSVSSDLAPSFTLTFSYFLNGIYHSEGIPFNVAPNNKAANVAIEVPSSVTANQATTINISTLDSSANALATSLLVDVVSANTYDLTNQVNPNILASFYAARQIMTSSSSSLSPIGSGGGRCGGGGGAILSFANAVGTTLYWKSGLQTNSAGQASVSINPPKGSWTVTVYAMSGSTQVGSQSKTFTAN